MIAKARSALKGIDMLQQACIQLRTTCSCQVPRESLRPRLKQHSQLKYKIISHASCGPVENVFSSAQTLIASGLSAVGLATLADKSSK